MPIKKNEDARKNLINSEVERAVKECQEAADKGLNSIQFTTQRDIQREVRDILDEEHDVRVPYLIFTGRYAPPSKLQIEHYGDTTQMKLKW
jgi:hypothetical protein